MRDCLQALPSCAYARPAGRRVRLIAGVKVPRNLHVSSDLLVELVGEAKVADLVQRGLVERSMVDYHHKTGGGRTASEADVASARSEVQRQMALLETEIEAT